MVRIVNHVTSDWKVENVNVNQIEVIDKPDDITKRFEQNDFTFKAGEKVFITSRCSIPRAKIKQSLKESMHDIIETFEVGTLKWIYRPVCYHGVTVQSGNLSKKVGMTPLEVIDILGKPQKEVAFQNTSKWTYPELTVIFENGRVKEVRF